MHVFVYAHVCVVPCRGYKKAAGPLELQFKVVVSCSTWVLGWKWVFLRVDLC